MSNRIIGIIMVVLLIIMGSFALMNREMLKGGRQAHENAEIILKYQDEQAVLDMDYLTQLEEKEFAAILDSSDTDPKEQSYTGVSLYKLLEDLEIETNSIEQVIIRGVDGYTVALSPEEVMDEDNIYLAYKLNGKFLKPKDKGGSGPYQIVIRKDQFSQRWCKFVVEIELK